MNPPLKFLSEDLIKKAAEFRTENGPNAEHHAQTMEVMAKFMIDRDTRPETSSGELYPPGHSKSPKTVGTESECVSQAMPRPDRLVHSHRVNGLNDAITIRAVGAPGRGGAHTRYILELRDPRRGHDIPAGKILDIQFQSRPISGPEDFDGWTNEALIAVVIDRMRGFQAMEPVHAQTRASTVREALSIAPDPNVFPCRENALALTHFEEGLNWLQSRTRDRMRRGVEGKHAS